MERFEQTLVQWCRLVLLIIRELYLNHVEIVLIHWMRWKKISGIQWNIWTELEVYIFWCKRNKKWSLVCEVQKIDLSISKLIILFTFSASALCDMFSHFPKGHVEVNSSAQKQATKRLEEKHKCKGMGALSWLAICSQRLEAMGICFTHLLIYSFFGATLNGTLL